MVAMSRSDKTWSRQTWLKAKAALKLLWPVDEQAEPDAFNRFLLKTQKLVPLSNFAIAEVGGREYYELVGELSVESSLRTVLIELRVLAQNAIEAASELRTEFAA